MNSATTREETLKRLYESYGYSHYKMSKFEEYDLYVRNKNFLISDHIITFTDVGGSLMALKPDVTLSIVKNCRESETGVRKVYYNENVYRVPKGGFYFKEIMQAGLECFGEIDSYAVSEVLMLAARSLEAMGKEYVIDVSHMGIISALANRLSLTADGRKKLISCIGEKNIHGISEICTAEGADLQGSEMIKSLVSFGGGCEELIDLLGEGEWAKDARELVDTVSALKAMGYCVNIDFSVTDDTNYYSGIVFKGFIKGIPTSVLTGGRYDNLMKKMGKTSGAIGFAVYLDLLGELDESGDGYDADVLAVYSDLTDMATLLKTTDSLSREGKRVLAVKKIDEKLKYKELIDLR